VFDFLLLNITILFVRNIGSFCKKRLNFIRKRGEKPVLFQEKCLKKFGPQGFLLTWAKEKYGGLGVADFRYQQIMQEEDAAYSDAGFYHTLHGRLVALYISNFSNEEQKSFFYLRVFSVRKFSL
jgi:alkylation response protein AidB-like acyl-CoA dehydrogenase